jgi:hypothetical protein
MRARRILECRRGGGFGDEVAIEERSFVAKGAPLDDGQKRVGDGVMNGGRAGHIQVMG